MNYLHRRGDLTPGRTWWLFWTRNGEPCGNIRGKSEDGYVVLEYRSRVSGGEWEDVKEPVRLVYTPCNFGGVRPWFVCPCVRNGVACRRRVGTLYAGGKYFFCRHCYDLAYQSQREDETDRLISKAYAIRKRLGGKGGIDDFFPPKPKGMHWKTYERLCGQAREAEARSLQLTALRFGLLPWM